MEGQFQPTNNSQNQMPRPQVMRSFNAKKSPVKGNLILVAGSILTVLLGVMTGYKLSGSVLGSSTSSDASLEDSLTKKSGDETVGVEDESALKTEAEGILREGGIEGEGTHHLERTGGDSQNVYLTSGVIDLQSFVGKKVQVWGQTISGLHAGWLMEVGKIKALE